MRHFLYIVLAAAATLTLGHGARSQKAGESAKAKTVATVNGSPITQAEFDRVAKPYVSQVARQMGKSFTPDYRRMAERTVLQELIRWRILVQEANRRGLQVGDQEVEQELRKDRFFYDGSTFNEMRFQSYRFSPGSNYSQVAAEIRNRLLVTKMEKRAESLLAPGEKELKAEFVRRNEQARITFIAVRPQMVILNYVPSDEEIRAYYEAHREDYRTPERLRLTYARFYPRDYALDVVVPDSAVKAFQEQNYPGASLDSLRATITDSLLMEHGWRKAREKSEELIAGVAQGKDFDTLAAQLGKVEDSGWFLRQSKAVVVADSQAILALPKGEVYRRSIRIEDGYLVAKMADREESRVPPLTEVRSRVRRDASIRKGVDELQRRAEERFRAHPDEFQTIRAAVEFVRLSPPAVTRLKVGEKDIQQYYSTHRADFAAQDSLSREPVPLDAALKEQIRAVVEREKRKEVVRREFAAVLSDWERGKRADKRAKTWGGVRQAAFLIGMKDTLSEFPVSSDSVFLLPPGRAKGDSVGDSLWVVYRVTDRNDRYIPTFAEAKARAESLVAEDERAVQLSEARTYFEAHASDYEIPQQYTIRYVLFARPPRDSIRVSDEDLKAYYDANLARYQRAEEVRARHLLVKVDAKANAATWAKAEDKARKLRAQLAGGADFAALVERHTDDTGTKERGGDLGFFARGQMVGPFEEAAFQLQPGELSGVVKTQYGYHILRVEEKRPAGPKPFEEVRAEIQQALVQPKQDEIAREEAEAFLKKLTGPDSLEAQAGTRKVKDSSPFAKGQPIPELGYVAQVDSVLESLKAGETGRMPARVWNGYIVFQMKEITPKHIPAFEEIKEKAARDYDRFRRNELARTEADAVRTRIQQGVSWEEAGANYGAPQTTDFFARAGSIRGLGQAAELGEQPFVLKPGDLSEVITLRSGFAFFKVAERKEADLELFAEQRKGLRETLFRERYAEWYAGLKTKAKIVIHVRELKEEEQQPRPGIPGLPPGLGG